MIIQSDNVLKLINACHQNEGNAIQKPEVTDALLRTSSDALGVL